MTVKSEDDVAGLKRTGNIVPRVLQQMLYAAEPGSHGVGRALHEEPGHIPGHFDPADRRL